MRRTVFSLFCNAVLVAVVSLRVAAAGAQIPDKFENLRVLPKDIPHDTLLQVMRGFSFALGVRCQHCHTGGDGVSFQGVDFASDDKAAKRNARFMLRMVDSLNSQVLAGLPERSSPPVRIACVTCHRGLSRPTTLAATLSATIAEKGIDSAIVQYRALRKESIELGRYDFGEWSMNELARSLREQGKTAEAVAMLELNSEFYPTSAAIDMMLGDLYRERGDRPSALKRYRMALEQQPNNLLAKRRVDELSKAP